MLFADRKEAGKKLAGKLAEYANRSDVVVLGLPRGGVPVAFEVARSLCVPLDVFIVRKLGFPYEPELAMGAIASGRVRVLNKNVIANMGISDRIIEEVTEVELEELRRRESLYRGKRPSLDVRGRTVILVDDGIATGASMRAAVTALRQLDAAKIVIAVPVAASSSCKDFDNELNTSCVFLTTLEPFNSIGYFYKDFSETTDEEVCSLLRKAEKI